MKKHITSKEEILATNTLKTIMQTVTITPIIVLLLLRILDELFENVRKHSESDRIGIYLNFNEKEIALQMSDNGIGITEDYMERLDGFQ